MNYQSLYFHKYIFDLILKITIFINFILDRKYYFFVKIIKFKFSN